MQSCCILQHAKCTVHRAATNLLLAPDKPVSECLPYDLKDQALFQGNVPQPQDWLRAWRASRTASSFASAPAFFQTDDFAAGRSCTLQRRCVCAAIRQSFLAKHLLLSVAMLKFQTRAEQNCLRPQKHDHGHVLGGQCCCRRTASACLWTIGRTTGFSATDALQKRWQHTQACLRAQVQQVPKSQRLWQSGHLQRQHPVRESIGLVGMCQKTR